jgi:hypothetical protein
VCSGERAHALAVERASREAIVGSSAPPGAAQRDRRPKSEFSRRGVPSPFEISGHMQTATGHRLVQPEQIQ